MTDRYTEFMTKLADLMDEHGVTFCAREDCGSYYCSADGIDIDFEFRPEDSYKSFSIRAGVHDINSADIRKIVEGMKDD